MPRLSVENYLADIYRLQTEQEEPRQPGAVSTGAVADRRRVSPASASAMFRRLSREGLLVYREYEGVSLTDEGERLALTVVRRHRIVERFLTDVLGMPWESVDGLADQMEHAFPDEVIAALERFLGNPLTCPHGYPIPDRTGHLERIQLRRVSELGAGESGLVARVDERVPGLLQYLDEIGMTPGTLVTVEEHNSIDETVSVSVRGQHRVIGPRITHAVSLAQSAPQED